MKSYARIERALCINLAFFAKLLGSFALLFLLLLTQGAMAETDSGGVRKLTEQEGWVLAQIKQGKEADLKARFAGDKEKYLLGAGFLEKLFTKDINNIQISHRGINISNAAIVGELNLENAEIKHPVYLRHCVFKGPVTFQKSSFKKDLSFQSSEFLNSANFKGIKVEGTVICNDTHFEAESLWNDARIGEYFQAERAEFRSSEGTADFNAIKIGGTALFTSAEFHGPVIFVVANIGRQFLANETKFFNREKLANFGGIKTGNTIFFNKTEFHGPVTFEFAEIGVNFRASGAKFLNERQPRNLSRIKVGQKLFMDGVVVRGDLNLSYGDFFDLEISGAEQNGNKGHGTDVSNACLDLEGSLVQRNLTIATLSLDELNARRMRVKGHTTIKDTQIKKIADFRGGSFQTLNFENVQWPEVDPNKTGKDGKKPFRYEVYLGEITFGSLTIDKPESGSEAKPYDSDYNNKDFKKIVDFVDACPFYTQSYVQVETFFKRIGRDSWANKVFMRMHNRELVEKMAWYDPRRWLEWFFWGKIAGYGRAPFRVFFLALAFIILGACLFDPIYLKENKVSHEGKLYKSVCIRFFISLDRFLPIELGLANHWDAQGRKFPVWVYFFLQRPLGWILIPIALASIYSQLK